MDKHPAYADKDTFLAQLETIKEWQHSDFETYSLVKRRDTGEHFLRYSFFHIALAEGGNREDYDYFLPLDHDDVLSVLFEEQTFIYPDDWTSVYWRSGRDNRLFLFDPRENFSLEEAIAEEQQILQSLQRYKQAWAEASDKEALTKQLFKELEQQRKRNKS